MPNRSNAIEWLRISYHDLTELYSMVESYYKIDINEIEFLDKGSTYYTENRYPNSYYSLPSREEIKEILLFASKTFYEILDLLNIDVSEL
ncbi:MAG: HEPN domain-containing protein [Spirochaetia bacterium]